MTKPIDLISRALKDIGALESGEVPSPDATQDAFDILNDLVDQWSNEDMMVFNTQEIIFPVVAGQIQYTIGDNPQTPNFVGASIQGTISGNILTVTGITSGAVVQGQWLQASIDDNILDGTKIVQCLTGAGGNVNEVGTYELNTQATTPIPSFMGNISGTLLTVSSINTGTLGIGCVVTGVGVPVGTTIASFGTGSGGVGTYTLNQPAIIAEELMTGTVTPITIVLYYQRPLFIDQAYVRVNTNSNGNPILNGGLDYQVGVLNLTNYNQIGLKTLNGPWPKALYYNPNALSGNLFLWPNPSQGEMHLFTSTLFSQYTNYYDDIALPQGYSMALRWNLAERLMPMYGKVNGTAIQMINAYAMQAKATLKRTNMRPIAAAAYPDSMLVGKAKDAGWILNGGFTS
jgi:hypothetical protein